MGGSGIPVPAHHLRGCMMPNSKVDIVDTRADTVTHTTESQLLNTLVSVIRERHAPTNTLKKARALITDLELVVSLYRARCDSEIYAQFEAELGIDVYPEMVSPNWQFHANGNGVTQ